MSSFIIFLAQLLLGVIALWMGSGDQDVSLLINGSIATVLYGGLAVHESRKERWFVSPIVAYLGMSALYVGVTPVWAYMALKANEVDVFSMGIITLENQVALAHGYGLIGSAFFYGGYKLAYTSKGRQWASWFHARSPDYKPSIWFWIGMIGLAWATRLLPGFKELFGQLGHLNLHLTSLTVEAVVIVMILRTGVVKGELRILPAGWRFYLALGLGALDLFIHAFNSGMRFTILHLIIMVLWGYILQMEIDLRDVPPMKLMRSMLKPALAFAVAGFLVLSIVLPFGKSLAKSEDEAVTADEVTAQFYEIGATFPSHGIFALPARLAKASLNALGACVLLSESIPADPPVLTGVLTGIVPRLLWPNKPWVSRGANFSIILEVGGGSDETSATTSTALTAIGELYWSYGITGVILGMAFLGITFAFAWEVFSYRFPLHPLRTHVSIYITLIAFMWFENDATSSLVAIIFVYIVFLPLVSIDFSKIMKKRVFKT